MEHCAVIEMINIPLQITQQKNHSNAKYYHKQVAKCRIGWGAKHRLCAGAKCRGAKMTCTVWSLTMLRNQNSVRKLC